MPEKADRTHGYDEDFHAWADAQARFLRGRRVDAADLENIAEELEGLSRSERGALDSSLRLIVLHCLKLVHQPERATQGWRNIIARERLNIEKALEDMPSLRPHLPELFATACRDGRRLATAETGLPAHLISSDDVFTLDQVRDVTFLPSSARSAHLPDEDRPPRSDRQD